MLMGHILSGGHNSHDEQVNAALTYLYSEHLKDWETILKRYPKIAVRPMEGSSFDYEAMGVEPEWSSWVADAIEDTGRLFWSDGELFVSFTQAEKDEYVANTVRSMVKALDELDWDTGNEEVDDRITSAFMTEMGWEG